nr:restriction endonuclease subunit S [Lactiplantibacillus plantarum]
MNYNLLLLFYISESICWKKYDESTGVPSLSKRTISSIPIEIPQKYTEQENIGKIFLKTDNLIAANEQVPKLVIKIVNNSLANSSFSN